MRGYGEAGECVEEVDEARVRARDDRCQLVVDAGRVGDLLEEDSSARDGHERVWMGHCFVGILERGLVVGSSDGGRIWRDEWDMGRTVGEGGL